MFSKICLKSKPLNDLKIDISFLVDSMLFYNKVIVMGHWEVISVLLKYFGEDLLEELIKTGRIELLVEENMLGSMSFPDGGINIDFFNIKDEAYSSILYQAHRKQVNNSSKNIKFSDKFSKITSPYRYDGELTAQIKNDFSNGDLLKRLLPIYLETKVPGFAVPENLQVEIVQDGSFGPFPSYSLKSNINLEELNRFYKDTNPERFYPIDYSGFLHSLGDSKGDIFVASKYGSEIVTSELSSKFINEELSEIIQKRNQSQHNIKLFDDYVLNDCHTLGDAFVQGLITKKELLKIYEKADKFRDWLLQVPEDRSLIGEYHKAVSKETIIDKLPTKVSRFAIFNAIGVGIDALSGSGLGTLGSLALSAFDSFYLDKLMGGWKPNHFIDNSLKPKITKG